MMILTTCSQFQYDFVKGQKIMIFYWNLLDLANFKLEYSRNKQNMLIKISIFWKYGIWAFPGKKIIAKSLLDQIEGIGSMRKRALLNHFGSARAVESASFDEIKSVEGVEEKVAKKIYNFFHE